jgi:hypothetical protein
VVEQNIYQPVGSDEAGEPEPDESQEHPLVPLGAINSGTTHQLIQTIAWPILTKHNSRYLFANRTSHTRDRVLIPLLGRKIVEANHGSAIFTCRAIYSTLRIGPWRFRTAVKGAPFASGSNHTRSYFVIKTKWIAHEAEYVEEHPEVLNEWEYDPEQLVVGQFHRFIQLKLPFWRQDNREHFLDECTLWPTQGQQGADPTQRFFDMRDELGLPGPHNQAKIKYVPLKHVHSSVAVVPIVGPDRVETTEFLAMPLQL